MYCPKCGSEIPEGYEYCMKCGTKVVPDQSSDQPNNDPIIKADKSKKFIPAVVAGLVTLIVILCLALSASGSSTAEKKGLFKGIEWGSDSDTVKKKMEKAFPQYEVREADDTIIAIADDYKGKKGVSCGYMLEMKGSGKTLNQVVLIYTISDDSKYSSDDVYDDVIEEYKKILGEPDSDKGYEVSWDKEESKVKILHVSDGIVMQSYEPN